MGNPQKPESIESRADKFFEKHKNDTGSDAGEKISKDFANVTQGMSKQQIERFVDRLATDSNSSAVKHAEKKENHDPVDFNRTSDGHLKVTTRRFGAEALHYASPNVTYTDVTAKAESWKKPASKSGGQGAPLEGAVDNVRRRNEAVEHPDH